MLTIQKPWRETNGIFLPKPGKVDYNDAKSYRTITLSSNFIKIHEKMILWYLEHDLSIDNVLNKEMGLERAAQLKQLCIN